MVDYQHLHRTLARFELEAKLFLQRF